MTVDKDAGYDKLRMDEAGFEMIAKWFNKDDSRQFIAYGEYGEGPPSDVSLVGLLNLNQENLKPFTKELLDKGQQPQWLQSQLSDLSRGINALFQFQDILDVKLDEPTTDLVNRHYNYYESLVYLRESVASWLDQNVLAGLTLLRPFLELSVLHIYWYVRCKHKSYTVYYDWLKRGRGKPGFQTALDHIFDNLPTRESVKEKRLQELKATIQSVYKTLCAYNHTPKIDESIAAKGGSLGNLALESFYYCLVMTNLLLRQVIYLYILAYPMSLFPVEKYVKWAFSGPVGLFFDNVNFAVVETYIGSENVAILRQSLEDAPEVKPLREWFDSLPPLTADEVEADWERLKQENPSIDKGISSLDKSNAKYLYARLALMKSHSRALSWALNYVTDETKDSDISEDTMEQLRKRMRTW
ncbi:hypothetical protein ACFLW0_04660 [Chloroflexota bacterium]